jgi:hypothetical protein
MCDSWPTVNLSEYKEQVSRIPCGKRLPTALYVHRAGLASVGGSLGAVLDQVVARYQVSAEFNLVKFRTGELKLSFLSYPGFDSEPHPALKRAITIDLATGKARHTDYADNANPPILHRKETFLPAGHPLRAQFEALTRAEEAAGLYESTETIGFKLNWQKLLESKGLALKGHTLLRSFPPHAVPARPVPEGHPEIAQPFKTGSAATTVPGPEGTAENVPATMPARDEPPVVVARHKTALTRYELSKPVKSLLEYGVLRSGTSFFDYGCGHRPGGELSLRRGRGRLSNCPIPASTRVGVLRDARPPLGRI